ncbi:MAG TPA: Gfo/Idh/MocA family oxidoreductase [Chitinophagaceae bacterium]|nr:Gfo/Idh/MocA family oxidoreductase [Chitinophagaceae bacterium]
MSYSRRLFIRNAGIAALGTSIVAAVPMEVLAKLRKNISPADRINVGLIGCKGMGWSNLTAMLRVPEVNCAAICDIDDSIINQRLADLQKINIKPAVYKDYRKLLDDKNIHVVIVATPDHWHCLQMSDACAAGKDVYVEKPIANSIEEAAIMVAIAKKYNRAVQVGQWQRSQQHFKNAVDFVHSGKLGKILRTKTWQYNGSIKPLPVVADGPVPPGVDYDMWLGPARKRPFNANRFHYNFRWYWDYAGGTMTDWGVHLIDMVLLGMKASVPVSVSGMGGQFSFPGDARETPQVQTAVYDFGDFELTWEHTMGVSGGNYGLGHGISFIGENATLVLNRNGWDVRPEKNDKKEDKIPALAWQPQTDNGLNLHTQNFIDVVRSRKIEDLNCPIEAGAKVAIVSHMGNIAFRTGKKIVWDEDKRIFLDKDVSKFAKVNYHNGWKLPST